MNPIKKLILTGLSLATLVTAAGIFGSGSAGAAGTTIECTSPDLVYCTVSNPAGISQVVVTSHTDFGDIELVNVVSLSCAKSIDMILGGDTVLSAGPITFDVTPCAGGLGLKGTGGSGGGRIDSFKSADPERIDAIGVQLGIMFAR
jgi:hypothetical protein